MPRRLVAVLGLLALLVTVGCDRTSPEPSPGIAAERRHTLKSSPMPRPSDGASSDLVYAPAHRLVRELDPPLPAAEPERCGVADEFRPALGCLESLPLRETTIPRPADGRVVVDGSLPRRLWNRPMLVEPRFRGEPLAGFKPASGRVLEAGFLGFEFETSLPPLDGEGDLEVQLRGYVVPPSARDFVTIPIEIHADDFLSVGLAMHEVGVAFTTGPVEFRVDALTDTGAHELFSETVAPGGNPEWLDRRIDLSDLDGTTARIRFRTRVHPSQDGTAIGFPLWGSPEIFQKTPRGPKRNVILISLDTWRHDYFGTDVSGGPVTPRLAALAAKGVVFEQALSTYPSTTAGHMSLLTGLYPITHQVRFANDVLGDAFPTLAEMLGAAGYQTGAVTEDAMLLAESGFAFGFDSYFENKGIGIWNTDGQIDSTLARSRRWLREHEGERFFLFIHTYQIHTPYEPPDELVFGPSPEELAATTEPAWVRRLRHRYAGEVRYADVALAEFLRELTDSGVLDDSIVVLTSDHGEEFAEHGRMGHSKSVYDEVLRVPLVFWAPGLVRPGVRVREMVSLVDVIPTLLDLLEIDAPPELPGRSFRSDLEGASAADTRPRFAEGPDTSKPGGRFVAVRTESHKWIAPAGSTTPTEIYDLRNDPNEKQSLDDDALRDVGRRHLARYRELAAGASPKRELDARTTEKLRALGYVE